MARKIRIQRKRRPWLYNATKHNFAIGKLCLAILTPWARAEEVASRQAYEHARTARTLKDVELKEITVAYRAEQARRTDLLNAKTYLDLCNKYSKGQVDEILYGIPHNPENDFSAAHCS